jgi:hypothetical protein
MRLFPGMRLRVWREIFPGYRPFINPQWFHGPVDFGCHGSLF